MTFFSCIYDFHTYELENLHTFVFCLFIQNKLAPFKTDLITLTAPQVIYDVFPALKLSSLQQG